MIIGLLDDALQPMLEVHQRKSPNERLMDILDPILTTEDNKAILERDGSRPTSLTIMGHIGKGVLAHDEAYKAGSIEAEMLATKLISDLQALERIDGRRAVDEIKDIYLIGCEPDSRFTLEESVKESFAETLARKLYEAGYDHILVHAFTPEYLGDPEVKVTRYFAPRIDGAQPEFYGFTEEGIRIVNDAYDYAASRNWEQSAADRYEALKQQHGRPPGGVIQGRDIKQLLQDPRNIVPSSPDHRKLLLTAVLSSEKMKVDSRDPLTVSCPDELSSLCFKKYLDTHQIQYQRTASGQFQLPDDFFSTGLPLRPVNQMICFFRDPNQKKQMIEAVRQDRMEKEAAHLYENFELMKTQYSTMKGIEFIASHDPVHPWKSICLTFDNQAGATQFLRAMHAQNQQKYIIDQQHGPDGKFYVKCQPEMLSTNISNASATKEYSG